MDSRSTMHAARAPGCWIGAGSAGSIIRSEWLRSLLYWIGNAPERMQVVLAGPSGEPEVGHVIERVGGEVRVISGVQEGVTTLYRLTVGDAIEFQRRMIAAREANSLCTWISFARWYGTFTDRVAVPTSQAMSDLSPPGVLRGPPPLHRDVTGHAERVAEELAELEASP